MKLIFQTKFLIILILLTTAAALSSCYPDYGLETEDFDIVATFKDDEVNFQNFRTFFMADSIIKIKDNGFEANNGQHDQAVLNEIENQMLAYGYTRVPAEANADVTLHVGITSSTTFTYYPGYWGGYYGWYYPWYGGYSYSYTTGSLILTMIDLDAFDETQQNLGAVWAGILNGVLDNSTGADIKARTIQGIEDMFNQSPYLKIIE